MIVNSNKLLKSANKKVKRLQHELIRSRAYSIIVTLIAAVFIVASCFYGSKYYKLDSEHKEVITEKENLSKKLEQKTKDYTYAFGKVQELGGTIEDLREVSTILDNENKLLAEANDGYWEELEELRRRKELYEEFEWALVNHGERTDITYEQLKTLPELLKDKKVNSEHLVLAIAMTESKGKEDAQNMSSSAKGYGQFLNSTSKFVYTKLMGNSNWTPSVALDGDVGLEMICEYINYLYENNGRDLTKTITAYRGVYDPGYLAKINQYLAKSNTSLSKLKF